MDITIKGVGAHTTYEAVGVNAIEPVIPIIQALKTKAFAEPDHDAFGPEKIVNIALVKGGLRRCLIPEECVLTVDVRFSPSTTAAAVLDQVRGILADIARVAKNSLRSASSRRKAASRIPAEPDGLGQASDPRPPRRRARRLHRQAAGPAAIRPGPTRRC